MDEMFRIRMTRADLMVLDDILHQKHNLYENRERICRRNFDKTCECIWADRADEAADRANQIDRMLTAVSEATEDEIW